MRNIKNNTKKSLYKKIFVKFCRLMGYEIVDQNDFYFPVSKKYSDENLSILGKNSITIPLGNTKIVRSVKSLNIILKTCTSVNLVSQSKKRIFEENKSEYTIRSLVSILNSLKFERDLFNKINLKIIIIDHNSYEKDLILIKQKLEQSTFDYEIINLDIKEFSQIKVLNKNNNMIENNMKATMASILKSFQIAKEKSEDLCYFVEDD